MESQHTNCTFGFLPIQKADLKKPKEQFPAKTRDKYINFVSCIKDKENI